MGVITGKDIRNQLKYDLIGKDSHRGITLSYGWLANQFGHFSLGYIPSIVIYLLVVKWTVLAPDLVSVLASSFVAFCWLWCFNLFKPLLFNKSKPPQVFKPAWGNLIFDTSTDLFFFFTGAFLAAITFHFNIIILIVILCLVIILFFCSKYWYCVKMYIQYARFPFQFRLSQWSHSINLPNKELVLQLKENCIPQHILIFGGEQTGKTSLSVALGTEYAIQERTCIYTTAIKFTDLCIVEDDELID